MRVDFEHFRNGRWFTPGMRSSVSATVAAIAGKRNPARQKRLHRNLIGRVQRRRSRTARFLRLIGQLQQRKLLEIGRLESPRARLAANPAAAPEPRRAPDRSARTGSASAYPSPKPAQSRCRRCTPPSHVPWTGDAPPLATSFGWKSNSQQASITSKPLFIKVAESMVMRCPIFQVG